MMWQAPPAPIRSRMPPCSGQSRPSPAGGRERRGRLDRPCARRLRDLAVGTEECSRRGSNQRMALQKNKQTDNFKPVVLSEFQAAVDTGDQLRAIVERIEHVEEE